MRSPLPFTPEASSGVAPRSDMAAEQLGLTPASAGAAGASAAAPPWQAPSGDPPPPAGPGGIPPAVLAANYLRYATRAIMLEVESSDVTADGAQRFLALALATNPAVSQAAEAACVAWESGGDRCWDFVQAQTALVIARCEEARRSASLEVFRQIWVWGRSRHRPGPAVPPAAPHPSVG